MSKYTIQIFIAGYAAPDGAEGSWCQAREADCTGRRCDAPNSYGMNNRYLREEHHAV